MRSLTPNFRLYVFRAFGAKSHTPGKADFAGVCTPFPRKGGPPGKVPLGVRLKSTRPSHGRVCWGLYPPKAVHNFLLAGLCTNTNMPLERRGQGCVEFIHHHVLATAQKPEALGYSKAFLVNQSPAPAAVRNASKIIA